MSNVRKYALPKAGLIPTEFYRASIGHGSKVIGMLVWGKINKYPLPSLLGKFYGWYHIAVSGDNYCNVTVLFVSVSNNLSGNTHICLFFLVGMDDIGAVETCDFLMEKLSQDNFEFRVFHVGLEKGILIGVFVGIMWSGRKIFDFYKSLIWFHKFLKQRNQVKPIIAFPPPVISQSIIEIKL